MTPRDACFWGCPRIRRQLAFTLVELMVVTATIALLACLVLPALQKGYLLAQRSTCQAKLKNIGVAVSLYQGDCPGYIPVCWQNIPVTSRNPWPSWRTSLLRYGSYHMFNCPCAESSGSETFHSAAEVTGHENADTANSGSYGLMYQNSLPTFQSINYSNVVCQGHPCYSQAFPTAPGAAWRNPTESLYIADARLVDGPVTYPSAKAHRGYGTSVIFPPSSTSFNYFGTALTRRFADRHLGTNCLFVGGNVRNYPTKTLDEMKAGKPDCIWDVD